MHTITFDFLGQHRHGSAFHEYLRLRKRFFVDELNWDIPHNDDVEMDQYDNPCAHYSLVLRNGRVVGGARIMPTTSTWGRHTYMLRDALRGDIEAIPAEVIPEEYASKEVWECTRLVVSDLLNSQSDRANCLMLIVEGLIDIANRNGGIELVTLTRPALVRALRQLGFAASRIGKPYRNGDDGREYAVLHMPAMSAYQIAAE
ncbi:acyl-homoserine-lactone synthase [Amaricoccus sp.]|uniref:acyl-homoserine-lactone synthase n=1 Tax=Amaricoccus sp. TaxID=1872485 RepID=UPI00261D1FF7|nr:acyl-homoserine-lactone synthase [Amaricoccus sp.]HRO10825.1 acyl-homoserine-lactone synthase [Amaricoccus sp.]